MIQTRSNIWLVSTFFWAWATSLLATIPGAASPYGDGTVCDHAARRAAAQMDLPADILLTLTRVETGRTRDGQLQPWPWTANVEGAGHWFDSHAEAEHFLRTEIASGRRSIDVGCFQLNYRWHGAAFDSIEAMLDPFANAEYAAEFLTALYAEFGGWDAAVGAYHSRTPRYANRYLARFQEIAGRTPNDEPPRSEGHETAAPLTQARGLLTTARPELPRASTALVLGGAAPLTAFSAARPLLGATR